VTDEFNREYANQLNFIAFLRSFMGSLQRFDLKKYIKAYNVSVLFETGAFKGNGIRHALEAGFEKVISTEIMDEFVELNQNQFRQYKNVTILKGNSSELLDKHIFQIKENTFFWLDAHYPGADGGLLDYNSDFDDSIKYPLENELRIIKKHRPTKEDVILIDDLRLYEEGDYDFGNIPADARKPENFTIDFVYDLFSDSHHIIKLYNDHGYLLLLPKTQKPNIYTKVGLREILRLRERLKKLFQK
jgi:hypothetical protein